MTEGIDSAAGKNTVARTRAVVENAARYLIVPAANFAVSWLVIAAASEGLWGRFVVGLMIVNLSAHVVSWGNKEYLLRRLSKDQDAMPELWQGSLATRAWGLSIPGVLLFAFGVRGGMWAGLMAWLALAVLYQSLDVIVLFCHRFRLAIIAEAGGLMLNLSMLLLNRHDLDEMTIGIAWVCGLLLKTAVVLIGTRDAILSRRVPRIDGRHIRAAAPFFLIGLSGLLQSKVDLYAIAVFLSRAELGVYQVVISFFIAVQSVAAFIVMPFVRDLYGREDRLFLDIFRTLFRAGLGVATLSVVGGWVVFDQLYGFSLSVWVYVVGALLVPPVFGTVPLIYLQYKRGREHAVVAANLAAAGGNLLVTVMLVPVLGFVGGLIGSAAAHWATMTWFLRAARTAPVPGVNIRDGQG